MRLFEIPGCQDRARKDRAHKVALGVLLAFSVAHIAATWGRLGYFGGDSGLWLHDVERLARGERLYADYVWPYPPLAMWLLGSLARLFSFHLNTIWLATSLISVLIFLAYYCYASLLVERSLVLLAVLSGVLLSSAYANLDSIPLAAGMYTPAAPVGFLFLIVAVTLSLRVFDAPRLLHVLGLGLLCGLSVLSKHDFWAPSLYVIVVACGVLVATAEGSRWRLPIILVGAFGLTVFAGTSIVAAQAGWIAVARIPGGFGQASEIGGRSFPSWERLTIEVTVAAALALVALLCAMLARAASFYQLRRLIGELSLIVILGSSIHLFMSYRTGLDLRAGRHSQFLTDTEAYVSDFTRSDAKLLSRSVDWLEWEIRMHLFPAVLPAALALVIILRWKRFESTSLRNTVLFLLGLCVAARSRRLVEHVDWYHFLLEIPVYAAALQLFAGGSKMRQASKSVAMALVALVVAGLYSYWYWGVGPLTRRQGWDRVETPRGSIYLRPESARIYRQIRSALERLDPTGERPLLAFPASGAFNYLLDRRNPTPLTVGFWSSNIPPNRIVSSLLSGSPRPFLLDRAGTAEALAPAGQIDWRHWDLKRIPNVYTRVDRPYFEAVLSHCRRAAEIREGAKTEFTIYDCAE